MSYDVDITLENAMNQAGYAAEKYLVDSLDILFNRVGNRSIEEMNSAIELAKRCAQDFHTTVIAMKLQEIRDAIRDCKPEEELES